MSQLSYSIEHAVAYEGTRADSRPCTVVPGLNKTGAEVAYGRAVTIDTTAARLTNLGPADYVPVKHPAASTDKVLGFVLHSHAHNPTNNGGVLDGDMLNVISKGSIWVKTEQAVDPSSPVFVRYASGAGGTLLGSVRTDADTATAAALTSARFLGKAAAGALVQLELNLP